MYLSPGTLPTPALKPPSRPSCSLQPRGILWSRRCLGVLVLSLGSLTAGEPGRAINQATPQSAPAWSTDSSLVSPDPSFAASPTPSLVAQTGVPGTDGSSPSREPLPEVPLLETLPDPEELLGPDVTAPLAPEAPRPDSGDTVVIQTFEIVGSTVFAAAEFAPLTTPYVDRPITFSDILELRDEITQLYRDNGYITSGAIVPPQALNDGVVRIQVVEGGIEDIVIAGTTRLNPDYVIRRLTLATEAPLQIDPLLEQLELLRLDPLIESIAADLQAGTRPGTNLLVVDVVEADSFDISYRFDNHRSPSVGSLRHQFRLRERNLTGKGDAFSLGYTRTRGSEGVDVAYTRPINPRNGTISITFENADSRVIEDPFDVFDISSSANVLELTLRQPIVQTPTQELALGLVASRQSSQTFLGLDDIGGFPLTAGADDDGQTRVTALRFFQEWIRQDTQQVIAVRSQFNIGLGALGATVNAGDDVPDSQFFSWLGQGQWVRLLRPNTPLIVRGSLQLTPDTLLTLERYGLGGQASVRGYRQDELLTDNGAALSAEVRFPLWRHRQHNGLLQLAPFIEGGYGWNNRSPDPDTQTLIGIGTGILFQVEDFDLRVDLGIPLIDTGGSDSSLQEQGVYFSLGYSFF